MLSLMALAASILFLVLNFPRGVQSAPTTSQAPVATPSPLVIPPSQVCARPNSVAAGLYIDALLGDGNDGPWSSFFLRVGTPAQSLRVLISTASNQPLVVLPEGCFPTDLSNCGSNRGSVFTPNASSTFTTRGIFSLAIETNHGISVNAFYGNDTVSLSLPGQGTPSLVGQNVGGIAAKVLFTGSFGLNPAATNFSTFNNPVESYMSTLKARNQIPSLSYGYTAGNQYRKNGVLASLTLGGYDAGLFEPNELTIGFDPRSESDLIVNINSIKVSSGDSNKTISSTTFPAFIDSTLPYLYLPTEVCIAFEAAFGIVHDNSSGLYLVNDTLHAQLLEQSANVTFSMTNTTGNTIVDIVFPYQAFDLTATWPLVESTSRYFPLKRAAKNTQMTLGRTFLQEAYLIADYERSTFSIHQRTYTNQAQEIRTILPPGQISVAAVTKVSKESNVRVAAAVGGSVGGAILITLIIGFAIIIRQRYKRLAVLEQTEFKLQSPTPSRAISNATAPTIVEGYESELDAAGTQRKSPEPGAGSPRATFQSILPARSLTVNTSFGVTQAHSLHELEANEPVLGEVAGSPVEQMLQEAIDSILQQQIRAWPDEALELRSMADEAASDIVSPMSPQEDTLFPAYREQGMR